ncbi:MAG: hypothetical protein RJA44_897, partial [Pseudomonadota bacterium]
MAEPDDLADQPGSVAAPTRTLPRRSWLKRTLGSAAELLLNPLDRVLLGARSAATATAARTAAADAAGSTVTKAGAAAAATTATTSTGSQAAAPASAAATLQRRPLRFPADHGAHPAQRTEWWYLTGWLVEAGASLSAPEPRWGFQLTFFRSRTEVAATQPSAFAARQLILAHAALSDLRAGRLRHDQRVARAGFGL